MNRKEFLRFGLGALAAGAAWPALAAYPDKLVMLIVPYPPGGMGSTFGNIVSEALTPKLGENVVVDYKAGANGALGAAYVAKAQPDGYTLLMAVNSTMAINPHLYSKLPFDPVKDFAPVSMIFTNANVLVVNASSPVRSVKDLIAYAKANPGKVNYGSAGNGSTPHLSGEMFRQLTGAPVVHVPYKGAGPAIVDLLGGQIDFLFVDTSVLPQVRSGKLRALAVTGRTRLGAAPELRTMEEEGVKGFVVDTWYSICAPAGTPPEAVQRLNTEIAKMLADPTVRRRMRDVGVDPAEDTSAAYLQKTIQADSARWKKFIQSTNIHLD
ncbi:tripartite tricarboxylate transporter substrate binding protein [Variovorax sp. YR216]|uniref:Bug family tripartite tricarboxylate transporter substrate binding protein n=1 Tax=Variovorax sp. YR216 TaxID=1882828 RepID=UPI00089C2F40|nr:tripartite tricarboxylate transporter substrate binding protein [Variovorax sp. YR216]SEB18627.1 Tripartite-type tricarboxylate transporter, receptor component TctC [Variovorax sp. YR216]